MFDYRCPRNASNRVRWTLTLPAVIWLALTGLAFAQPGKRDDPLSWDRNIRTMFGRYCLDCHREDDPSGNVNLAEDENPRQILQHRRKWETVLQVLEAKQMPPEDERQPSAEQRGLMMQFIQLTLSSLDCDEVDAPGRPVLRRLNRAEYNNCVQDLVGLPLTPADSFPPDPTGYGFDNIADAMTLTPTQVEMYHDSAKQIMDAVEAQRQAEPQLFFAIYPQLDGNASREQQRAAALQSVQHFAAKAFRRPADDYFVNRVLRIYDRAIEETGSFERAVRYCFETILIAPQFLFRVELDRPNLDSAYAVDGYELASRLSFLVWSRGPDDRLRALAKSGELLNPDVLDAEVDRLLQDPRSDALVDNFFAQWLDLRNLDKHAVDTDAFPDFAPQLRDSMRKEAALLLRDIVRDKAPLTALIDHEGLYIDETLAEHYGLPKPNSTEPVFVSRANRNRGGLLTSAAMLTLQADPNRTNIPRRGNFVAGQILGDAPPPPPPDVPPLVIPSDGKPRTLREIFELHRSSPECASCHEKIDPLGFALENFDAIGRWRTTDGGADINATSELADGSSLVGVAGLKDYLLSRQSDVVKQLSSKLLVYALGRGLEPTDECVIQAMLEAASSAQAEATEVSDSAHFSDLVKAIVSSKVFTHRKNAEF